LSRGTRQRKQPRSTEVQPFSPSYHCEFAVKVTEPTLAVAVTVC
jgi:hypothetical protein